MLKSSKIIILSIITLTILPCLVFGYHVLNLEISPDNYVFRRWSSVPQQFRVDSGPLGGVDGLPTVQSACNEWNNVPDTKNLCSNTFPRTAFDVDESTFPFIVQDDINDVVFDNDEMILANIFGFGTNSGILGIGDTRVLVATGEILEATLIINGTIPSTPSADLLATTVHEFGHIWGLAHTPIGGINTNSAFPVGLEPIDPSDIPTMFPFALPVSDAFGRTLEHDDEAIIKLQYPE